MFPTNLSELKADRLRVITFNYDRSFESYLLAVLESQYRLPAAEAVDVLRRIEIEHVYGQLGGLDEVPYGDARKVAVAARGIRLIRPDADNPTQQRIEDMIRRSTYINFIGFGFDEDNVKLLGPENFKRKRVYSTSRGLSARTRHLAFHTLRVQFDKTRPDLDAAELFQTRNLFGPKAQATRPRATRAPGTVREGFARGWRI